MCFVDVFLTSSGYDRAPNGAESSPEKGARLLNWHVNMSDGSVRDVIHWPENNENPQLQEVHGGIPILFPFAGACFHEGKENHWRGPDGAVRQMPLHGFARDSEFTVRSIDTAGFEVELVQTEASKENYPFEYTFTVIYHFLELLFPGTIHFPLVRACDFFPGLLFFYLGKDS